MVVGLPPSVRIYMASATVDMRNGIDGLRAIVAQVLKQNPDNGHLFVFIGKSRDRVKILFWDKNGYVVYLKRLERGRFQQPTADSSRSRIEMEAAQLAMLLDGIDLNAKRLRRWTPTKIDTDRQI